jgi:hypothetical protein
MHGCRLLANLMQAMNRVLAVEYSLNFVGKYPVSTGSAIVC